MTNRIVLNETSYFGRGSKVELANEVKTRGFKKVLVVTHSAVLRVIHYMLGKIPEDGNLSKIHIPNLRIIEYEVK